jgi:hypothetical protein
MMMMIIQTHTHTHTHAHFLNIILLFLSLHFIIMCFCKSFVFLLVVQSCRSSFFRSKGRRRFARRLPSPPHLDAMVATAEAHLKLLLSLVAAGTCCTTWLSCSRYPILIRCHSLDACRRALLPAPPPLLLLNFRHQHSLVVVVVVVAVVVGVVVVAVVAVVVVVVAVVVVAFVFPLLRPLPPQPQRLWQPRCFRRRSRRLWGRYQPRNQKYLSL